MYRRLEDGAEALPAETEVALDGARYARRDNLTDWALGQFQDRYRAEARLLAASLAGGENVPEPFEDISSREITKADVFHYVYAVLHHPAYRARYAADLKRSLPRIPFAPTFWGARRGGPRARRRSTSASRRRPSTRSRRSTRPARR